MRVTKVPRAIPEMVCGVHIYIYWSKIISQLLLVVL